MSGDFRYLDEIEHWRGRFLRVGTGRFEAPDGSTFERVVVRHPGAVSVVPLTDDGDVVLVRQYRSALDRRILEIPAGLRDVEGEDPAATGARELAEEVGLAADRFELLAAFHNSPGFTDERVHIFLATGLHEVPSHPHGLEEEHMEVVTVPLEDAVARVREGEITDAKTVIALLLTADRLAAG